MSGAEGAGGEIILYEAPDGQVRVDVRLERETVWLPLNQMAKLFGRDKSVISRHLRNVFASRELERDAVVAKSATTASDGKTYQVEYFNLDAILSVGYRVNSKVVLALLVAESDAAQKDLMIRLILNLLDDGGA
jgi:hypothetical protein